MKTLLIGPLALLLSACSLFSPTPQRVIDGQRAAYQAVLLLEDNINVILDTYEQDNKAAVTYHLNFVSQTQINSVLADSSLSQEERLAKVTEIEEKKEAQLQEVFAKIEARREELAKSIKNIKATKQLLEAVYYYMASEPITLDNIDFWIEKLAESRHGS